MALSGGLASSSAAAQTANYSVCGSQTSILNTTCGTSVCNWTDLACNSIDDTQLRGFATALFIVLLVVRTVVGRRHTYLPKARRPI